MGCEIYNTEYVVLVVLMFVVIVGLTWYNFYLSNNLTRNIYYENKP
jgi:hypothetical protein